MNNDIYCKWCMEKNTAPQITPRDENRFSVSPAFNRSLIKEGSLDLNMQHKEESMQLENTDSRR